MNKRAIVVLLFFCAATASAQKNFLVFKKRNKTIALYTQNTYITFLLKNEGWITGYITRVQHDSFYVKPMVVRYQLMGIDTVYFEVLPVALADVFAMPRKGAQMVFVNDEPKMTSGNEHWVWFKNGWLFMIAGGGYTILNATNTLLQKEPPFAS